MSEQELRCYKQAVKLIWDDTEPERTCGQIKKLLLDEFGSEIVEKVFGGPYSECFNNDRMSTRELIQEKLEIELGEEIFIQFEPYHGNKQIKLDGTFTITQLEKIVQIIREHYPELA